MDLTSFSRLERIYFVWTQFDIADCIRPILPPVSRKIHIYLDANSNVYDEQDWKRLSEALSLLRGIHQLCLEEIRFSDVHTLTSSLLRETLMGIAYLPTLRLNNCRALVDLPTAFHSELRIGYLAVEGCRRLQMHELEFILDQGIASRIDVLESSFSVGDSCRVNCFQDLWFGGFIVRVKANRPFVADVKLAQSVALWQAGLTPGTLLEDVPRLRLRHS